jgi:hypothetical protein
MKLEGLGLVSRYRPSSKVQYLRIIALQDRVWNEDFRKRQRVSKISLLLLLFIIIIIINCNWVFTRLQWLIYMYTIATKFTSRGLHGKHVVETWNFENHLSICFYTQGNQEKFVPRWPVAGPSVYWLLSSSPASKVKHQYSQYSNTSSSSLCSVLYEWPIDSFKASCTKSAI